MSEKINKCQVEVVAMGALTMLPADADTLTTLGKSQLPQWHKSSSCIKSINNTQCCVYDTLLLNIIRNFNRIYVFEYIYLQC